MKSRPEVLEKAPGRLFYARKNLCQADMNLTGKADEWTDICNRNQKNKDYMEVMTIESKAFAALVEKIDGIAAYVEASRQKEAEQQGEEAKSRRKADKWMTGEEVCQYLEISARTLQRYRSNRIIAFSICGKKIRYRRRDVEEFHERWMRETPDKQVDRMIEEHPLHQRKNKLYGKKRGNTGENE